MIINLFDANFSQSICSVAHQVPKYIEYVRGKMSFDGITIFTDQYINSHLVDEVQSKYKIGWLHEPQCLQPLVYREALNNLHKFDFILTYYAPYLKVKGFRFCPYGGIWLQERGIQPKSKLCSMLIGNKMTTEGHKIRQAVADLVDVDFYGSRGMPVDYSSQTKLLTLADYHYSIITETCREDNLFTEWLLDCFAVGTIPIYWGCPNIGHFFDSDGVLSFADLDDLLEIMAECVSVEDYQFEARAIMNNLNLMEQYAITEDWMYQNIFKDLE